MHEGDKMSKEDNQIPLFEIDERCKEEWQGMPEYIQKRIEPVRIIKIHFQNQEDIDAFGKLIGQKIHPGYNTYWYPKLDIKTNSNQVYVDDNES